MSNKHRSEKLAICTSSPIDPAINSSPDLDVSIHLDESIPPLPPPMPPLDELVQRNKTKIATDEAAVNTNAKKLALEEKEAAGETDQRSQ